MDSILEDPNINQPQQIPQSQPPAQQPQQVPQNQQTKIQLIDCSQVNEIINNFTPILQRMITQNQPLSFEEITIVVEAISVFKNVVSKLDQLQEVLKSLRK